MLHVDELRSQLDAALQAPALLPETIPSTSQSSLNENISKIFRVLLEDVHATKDRLNVLNPGRKTLVERRIDYIARRIAYQRGERFTRTVRLDELLKDPGKSVTGLLGAAWNAFLSEVALYNIFELFFVKCLDFHGWRSFDPKDVKKLNFTAHTFLSQRGLEFTTDKHCWNFVRGNVYSWYNPTESAAESIVQKLVELEESTPLSWSAADLFSWVQSESRMWEHLGFTEEARIAKSIVQFMEDHLDITFVHEYARKSVCPKVFIPTSQTGAIATEILGRLLNTLSSDVGSKGEKLAARSRNESTLLQNALWVCEPEALELYWTEVGALLRTIAVSSYDRALPAYENQSRIPHVLNSTQLLALELHNMEGELFSGPGLSTLQQGTAGMIQQQEQFDISIVQSDATKLKSAQWLAAIASQLKYWKQFFGAATTLNVGELNLILAISKLKDGGKCVYFSNREIAEGRDGEKLRKYVLGNCSLEMKLEIKAEMKLELKADGGLGEYKHVYVFKKVEDRIRRDQARAKIGSGATLNEAALNAEICQASNLELSERGWQELKATSTAPIIRLLDSKYPKLQQVASITPPSIANQNSNMTVIDGMTINVPQNNLLHACAFDERVKFCKKLSGKHLFSVYLNNPQDLSWMQAVLNSALIQTWIRHYTTLSPTRTLRIQDAKNIPVLSLENLNSEEILSAQEYLGTYHGPTEKLIEWANQDKSASLQSKLIAAASHLSSFDALLDRYKPLFKTGSFDQADHWPEIRPEGVLNFYPERMLSALGKSPNVKIQLLGKERCPIASDHWIITSASAVIQPKTSIVILTTRQATAIQISVPTGTEGYIASQVESLKGHHWVEIQNIVRVPVDAAFFVSQIKEITRVISSTITQAEIYKRILNELVCGLFGIDKHLLTYGHESSESKAATPTH